VEFKTADGASRHASVEGVNSIYDKYDVGDPVQVTYVRSSGIAPASEPGER
jgi:hypothetical protein